ncbi:ash family protein [Yersinia enterocolitica]|uniref:ash family protein n=1 Tax=Yersinia enterocolitica TaxID=630 RepID=UPI003F4598D5
MSCTYKNRLPNTITGRYISPAAAKSAAGFRSPDITKAHNRASGFFMRKARPRFRTMVGRAGALSGAPGSLVSGTANPVRLTTLKSFAALGGELIQTTKEVASWQIVNSAAHSCSVATSKPKSAVNLTAHTLWPRLCHLTCYDNLQAQYHSGFRQSWITLLTICATLRKRPASWVCCRAHLKTSTISSQGVLPPLAREMT